ncbi:MAG: GPW/gp25 family protein [Actinobacteria bacterium]|nr:GPW/gp25 family protein [Actinomycetota bacterium]
MPPDPLQGIESPQSAVFPFPLAVGTAGRIDASGGDEALRGKIVQVLFTAPGERVNRPDFGCGLFNLVFEPANDVLVAAMEFTIAQALTRWLGDDIVVNAVDVAAEEETVAVQIVYTRKQDLARQAVRIQFR